MPVKYDPQKHHRRSIRLKGYDYSKPGAYFVTIVTHNRRCFFGKTENGKIILNEYGEIARQCLLDIPKMFLNTELDEFIIMPDHIHAIIKIKPAAGTTLAVVPDNDGGAVVPDNDGDAVVPDNIIYNNFGIPVGSGVNPDPTGKLGMTGMKSTTLGDIVGAYKSIVANKCLSIFKQKNQFMGKLWHRNYYEHIIRNNVQLTRIRRYILNNPSNWNNGEFS